jgi:hypothetical protein
MNPSTLHVDHPDIYENGPTDAMHARWDTEWGARRLPWSGEWPGMAECREFGWYARLVPDQGWVSCDSGADGAHENLNRLYRGEAIWDQERGRFVLRPAAREDTHE